MLLVTRAAAQPQPPERKYIFLEDKEKKDEERRQRQAIRARKRSYQVRETNGQLPLDVSATSLNFDQTGSKLLADGGVIITYSSFVLEALKGVVDIQSKEAELSGDVRISDVTGTITADQVNVDLDEGTGSLTNADILFADGGFRMQAEKAEKEAGDVYHLVDSTLTTCNCPDGNDCPPWRFRANEAEVIREGYGQVWGATLDVFNVPVLYTPYLIFPAKSERQSGFLPATFGRGRRSGFDLEVPFFWAIDESTDATIKGIVETNVRVGVDTELRKIFSYDHRLEGGLIYLNESARDGALLGTNTSGLDDPTFGTNRFGGYLDETWRGDVAGVPLQFILDGKYVSDDLFVREYENDKIAKFNSRFVTSRAVLRAPVASSFTLDLSSEYNQSLVSDDDFVLQRLPELSLSGLNSFDPFGDNMFGLKLVSTSRLTSTNFSREKSYEGSRSEAFQQFKIPFHFRNIVDSQFDASVRASYYNLTDNLQLSATEEPDVFDEEELEETSDRLVPSFGYRLGTVLEKVVPVSEGNPLKLLGELGTLGRSQEMVRLKHTVEPTLRYRFIPKVNQEDTPIFDAGDHIPQRNVVTAELTQRLYARYSPRNPFVYGIEEATPKAEDVESLRARIPLDQEFVFGFEGEDTTSGSFQQLRSGSVRELGRFKLSQSFDVAEARRDLDPEDEDDERDELSDLSGDLLIFPNDYVALRGRTDLDVEENDFSSYSIESQLQDKRGDQVRTRLRFIEDSVRQLESSIELKVTERVKLGYYSRYDDLEGEFIETKAGVRLLSKCNCWMFDVNYTDRINPDETKISFNITLEGLGELNQRFFSPFKQKDRTTTGTTTQ